MLVITRRRSESIKIGDDITITVTKIKGNQVMIGVDAPRELLILRTELDIRNKDEADSGNLPPVSSSAIDACPPKGIGA